MASCLVSLNSSEMTGSGLRSSLHQSQELGAPTCVLFSLGLRLPPGCDRRLHSFFCGGWGLPSGRKWHPRHSASLLLPGLRLQAPGPCHRGSGHHSLSDQGRAGRGLNCQKELSDREARARSSRFSSSGPSWCPQNHSALNILIGSPTGQAWGGQWSCMVCANRLVFG